MKRLLFLLLLLVPLAYQAQTGAKAIMHFDQDTVSFGIIKQGKVCTHTFTFKNTGTADLIIKNAMASCGCTAAEFTTTPVKPGQTGIVKVKFDSNGKQGQQHKTVTLMTNGEPSSKVLRIYAIVKPVKTSKQKN